MKIHHPTQPVEDWRVGRGHRGKSYASLDQIKKEITNGNITFDRNNQVYVSMKRDPTSGELQKARKLKDLASRRIDQAERMSKRAKFALGAACVVGLAAAAAAAFFLPAAVACSMTTAMTGGVPVGMFGIAAFKSLMIAGRCNELAHASLTEAAKLESRREVTSGVLTPNHSKVYGGKPNGLIFEAHGRY